MAASPTTLPVVLWVSTDVTRTAKRWCGLNCVRIVDPSQRWLEKLATPSTNNNCIFFAVSPFQRLFTKPNLAPNSTQETGWFMCCRTSSPYEKFSLRCMTLSANWVWRMSRPLQRKCNYRSVCCLPTSIFCQKKCKTVAVTSLSSGCPCPCFAGRRHADAFLCYQK